MTPPKLKPVVTNPNTLPNEPAGVTARTIMSRDGWMMRVNRPPSDMTPISSAAGMFTQAIRIAMGEVQAKPSAATLSWCGVRSARMPPSSTPPALNSRKPDSATLATEAGVPWSAPMPTTAKVWRPQLAMGGVGEANEGGGDEEEPGAWQQGGGRGGGGGEDQPAGQHESWSDAVDQEAGRRLQQRRGDVEDGDRECHLGVADAERLLHLAEDRRQQHAVHMAHEVRHGDQADHLGVAAPPGLRGRQGDRFTRRRH